MTAPLRSTSEARACRGQTLLSESYGTKVSHNFFISSVTVEVMAKASTWWDRPLEVVYPTIFLIRCIYERWFIVRSISSVKWWLFNFGLFGVLHAEVLYVHFRTIRI